MIHDWNLHLTNDIPGLVVRTVPQLFGVAWLFVSCYLIEVKIIVIRDKWSLVQVKSVQGTPITPPHLCVAPCCCVALNSKSMHAKFLFFSGQIIMIRASVNKKTPRELVSCEIYPLRPWSGTLYLRSPSLTSAVLCHLLVGCGRLDCKFISLGYREHSHFLSWVRKVWWGRSCSIQKYSGLGNL